MDMLYPYAIWIQHIHISIWICYIHIFRKDISIIERVHIRNNPSINKLIEGLRDMSYSEPLSQSRLISMENIELEVI